uniref:Fatty acid 2-hydroxylase n=1 Tax=Pyramimonas obovata TaxID=1411642 RepID=A0A7S0WN76_9CHLO|mmetsp:Transcript_31727/g.69336  ORF Transcript_31727/g.69336 Transcript_31727/m.69336 type:complete len:363 (+) Transcript_31727:122-1210(+)|eukprot:CAMPEP_0118921110 /NCGR_PEP_ID=MMETSP1169-20130426/495_1 /TAXON_ID=36882 /ORGANISM="Pyramimonas obovata, Strain CCMP722" /LENGTH=362 /DNA_ID=CAMNT_0006861777 /DNA_START=122 /DNA_END=1210 /DNA_ORIENTATION=+
MCNKVMGGGSEGRAITLVEGGEETPNKPMYRKSEIKARVDRGEALVMFDGGVYDIEPYMTSHPGGKEVLTEFLGEDVSEAFRGLGAGYHEHSKVAMKQLGKMLIGYVEDGAPHHHAESAGREDQSVTFEVDREKGVVLQVWKLGSQYDKWVHTPDLGTDPLRFFDNPVLELFSKTRWWVIPLVWLPVAFAAISSAVVHSETSLLAALQFATLGAFLWTSIEYTLHRFVFHSVPTGPMAITMHFLMHGCHHKRPMDRLRLVFPPAAALPIVVTLGGLIRAALPHHVALCVTSGALVGYVCYDMGHYYLHYGKNHVGTYLGAMKTSHMAHHYKDHSVSFGITSPLWDHVFGTLPKPNAQSTVQT